MAPFTALANETLLQIFGYLKPAHLQSERTSWESQPEDMANLHNLAITCRPFTPLAQSLLYNEVAFYPQGNNHNKRRFKEFCRSIQSRPYLGTYVRSFDLKLYCSPRTKPFSYSYQLDLIELFRKMQRLASLTLEDTNEDLVLYAHSLDSQREFLVPFFSSCLSQSASNSLKTVYLFGESMECSDVIFEFMAAKKFTSIHVPTYDRSHGWADDTELPNNPISITYPHVKELSIGYRGGVQARFLREIFDRTPNLNKLSVAHPGFETSQLCSYQIPWKVTDCFGPLRSNLIELEIDCRGHFPGRRDNSHFDLSEFKSLKRVHLPSGYLFTTSLPNESRNGLFKRFPSSLQELAMTFEYDSRIVEIDSVKETINPSDYQWILELATNKRVNLANLETIRLEWQCTQAWRDDCGQFICWEYPAGFMCNALKYPLVNRSGNSVDSWVNSSKWKISKVLATAFEESKINFFAELAVEDGTEGAFRVGLPVGRRYVYRL